MIVLTKGAQMATSSLVNIRMDNDLKREMEATCRELGLTMTAAFTIFARKMTREQRIPFDVSVDQFYSQSNLSHLRQVKADAETGVNMAVHDLIET